MAGEAAWNAQAFENCVSLDRGAAQMFRGALSIKK
jgi:hypothetical protein